jgi:hypothetical protein
LLFGARYICDRSLEEGYETGVAGQIAEIWGWELRDRKEESGKGSKRFSLESSFPFMLSIKELHSS